MANDRFQYTLAFTADTKQAKAQMKELQSQISSLINTANTKTGQGLLSSEISKASTAAAQLKIQLQDATNATTGKLDLTKFNQSLQKSGLKISDYRKSLMALGPEGEQAFANLATAISQADMPMLRLSAKAKDLVNTLSNTVKWQISSSAIHGFMGAVQGAYGYAQDLNKSLNDIRIVTGQSTDEMAKFAKQANNAAKALSTSTTKYTEAALIYYQQGLTDEQVKARTDTTIKMANVTGENAADVSSYMTAIWNNFAEGSDNLEYFSDVITALGAATAASSEEIAGGLEKFAAVGETVGLSYEYATAALTTIIDKTRQSEDVVGTALKTIFARIQGLQQGETAEDGVTLNKYSNALANVGIQIIDANGNLKEMDKILDELGAKWNTLGKAEQVALAQTVGGTRQYTQLVALMDNWGAMQENLNTAYNSEGALQEQADIYAESWEAAQKRVTAALQDIYDSLLNDKFFIGINNMFASTLNIFGDLIDGFGGFKGILITIGTIAVKYFKGNILSSIESVRDLLFSFTEKGRNQVLQLKKDANKELTKMQEGKANTTGYMIGSAYSSQASMQDELLLKSKDLTAEQEKIAQILLDQHKTLVANVVEEGKILDKAEKKAQLELRKGQLADEKRGNANWDKHAEYKAAVEQKSAFDTFQKDIFNEVEIKNNATDEEKNSLIERAKKIRDAYKQQYITKNKEGKEIDSSDTVFGTIGQNKMKAFNKAVEAGDYEKIVQEIKNMSDATKDFDQNIKESRKGITVTNEMTESYKKAGEATGQVAAETLRANANAKTFGETLGNFVSKNATKFQNGLLGIAQSLGQVAMIINGFNSLSSAWNMDEDISLTERLTRSASALAMILPAAVGLMKSLKVETIASGLATMLTSLGFTNLAGSIAGATTASALFKAMTWEVWAILGAVAIAIGLVIAGFVWFYKEINKDKIALEKANKELENSKKAADEAASAYNDLKSSIDSLESAQDTLKGLTKGTLEWQEAVLKVNEQVLNLIDKYPELAQYMTNTDGVLGFEKGALDKVLNSQYQQVQAMQTTYMVKQRNVAELKANQDINKHNVEYIDQTSKNQRYNSDGNYNDGTDKSTTIVSIPKEELKSIAQNLKYKKDGSLDFDAMELQDASAKYKEALNANIPTLEKLRNTIESADEQLRKYDENIASSWLNNYSDVDSTYKSEMAVGMSSLMDDYRKEYIESSKNATQEQIIATYASMTGASIASIQKDLDDNKYTINNLKDSIISQAAAIKSYQDIKAKVDTFDNGIRDKDGIINIEGAETARKLIAANGDMSSLNALTEAERQEFLNSLSGTVGDGIKNILGGKDGEGYLNNLKNYLSDENYNKEEAARLRTEQFNASISSKATELNMDEDALKSYVQYIQSANDELKNNEEAALATAEANIKFARGAEKVREALDDNLKVVKKADKATVEYHEALAEIQAAGNEMLGLDLGASFYEDAENLKNLEKAANGSEEALAKLQKAAINDWAKDFAEGWHDVKDAFGEGNDFDADEWSAKFISAIGRVSESLSTMSESFNLEDDIGKSVDGMDDLIEATNQAAAAGQMTAEDMKKMFGELGYSPEIDMIPSGEFDTQTTGYDFDGTIMGIPVSAHLTGVAKSEIMIPKISDKNGDGKTTFTKLGNTKLKARSAKTNKSANGGGSKKDKKKASDEIERYHEIKETLDALEKQLDSISKAKDRAFGQEKLDLIDKEIAKTKELTKAQEQYIKEIEANVKKDKTAVEKLGAKIDENGVITNYDELMNKLLNKFNNSARGEKDEEEYNKAKEIIKQWEETADLLADEKQKLLDYINQELDQKLEKIEYELEIRIQISDDSLKYLDYLLNKIEDQAFSTAEAINLLGDKVQENMTQNEANKKSLIDALGVAGIDAATIEKILAGDQEAIKQAIESGKIDAKVIESIRKYRDGLMDSNEAIRQLQKTIDETLIKALDDAEEEFGKLNEVLEHNQNVLSGLQNIMDLTGESILGPMGDVKKAIQQSQLDTATTKISVSYDKAAAARKAYEDAVKQGLSQDVIDAAAEKMRQAEEELLSDTEAAIQAANEIFKSALEETIKSFSDTVAGLYGSMDDLKDAFDKQKELNDIYVDDYKKIYELTKLSRDLSKSIDDTDSIKAKNALKDLQAEINELQKQGVELSEYDISYLQKKYELKLAEIALEEAQNAKSTVRMTRDSEGNWSYTYTASQEDIDKAQQNYEDKLYAIQELSDNYIEDMQSQIIDLISRYEDEMANINFSEEGWEQKAAEIEAFYKAKFNLLAQQFEGALGNQSEIYGEWEDYSALTGYGISANQDFINSFDETTLSQLTGFQTIGEYQEAFVASTKKVMQDLTTSFATWEANVKKIYEEAGLSVDEFGNVVKKTAEQVEKDNKKISDSSEDLKEKVKNNFEEGAKTAAEVAKKWNKAISSMTEENEKLIKSINDIIKGWAKLDEQDNNKKKEDKKEEPENQSGQQKSSTPSWDKVKGAYNKIISGAWGNGAARIAAGKAAGYTEEEIKMAQQLVNKVYGGMSLSAAKTALGFDTGGYTGAWGSSGRLAFLHEKELVLNADDTTNILKSIEMIRSISQLIDLKAASSALSNLTSATALAGSQTITQEITINAEFPDATDRDEISAAFDNLFIRASQYANRK